MFTIFSKPGIKLPRIIKHYSTIGKVSPSKLPKKSGRFDKIPSLEDFLYQRKVLKLYREIIRVTHQLKDENLQKELITHAKGEFSLYSKDKAKDRNEKNYLLIMGKNQFEMICKQIGLSFPTNFTFDNIK